MSYKPDLSPVSLSDENSSSNHDTMNLISPKRRILHATSRCSSVNMWLSHIEEPYISQLGSTHRNKQPYGKQTYFFTASFYLFQNSAMPQIQNINTAPSGEVQVLESRISTLVFPQTSELQLTTNLEQALCQLSMSS